jgi:hypothetical protein
MDGHGRAAYAAYFATVGGRTHDDKPMPTWDRLTDTIRSAWTMAALAAIAQHEATRGTT